jgi:hypothetical protein
VNGPCRCGCGRPVTRYARLALANACARRWWYHGRPAVVPPATRRGNDGQRDGRIEDYVWLTREQRLSRRAAAERLGVCLRTVERYEADPRAQAAA